MKLNHIFSKMKKNPYTILLQGVTNEETFNLWIKNYKDFPVVVSVWEDEDLERYEIPKGWKVVVNQYPLMRFAPIANLDYQIITTLKGLDKVKTEWVIKMRCDEYYSNLDKVYKKMIQNPEKIVSSSMFFRKWKMYPFHCSDKLLGGKTDNLFAMYESTLHNLDIRLWNTKIPESQLGLGYVMAKENDLDISTLNIDEKLSKHPFDPKVSTQILTNAISTIIKESTTLLTDHLSINTFGDIEWKHIFTKVNRWNAILNECSVILGRYDYKVLDEVPYMKKWFDIIDINELKPYIATRNFGDKRGRVWYRDDFDNESEDCLSDITQ